MVAKKQAAWPGIHAVSPFFALVNIFNNRYNLFGKL
jgi:hypothetical protein